MFLGEIFVYPIKSARGISVSETQVDAAGPASDRRWMIVDEQGVFLSQREVPRMALIHPRFDGDDLVVCAPGMPALRITNWSGEGERIRVKLWRDSLELPHPNQAYSNWFSTFLDRPCRVVYLPDTVVRHVEPPFDGPEWRVSLADGYPLLVLTQASLDHLNEKLATPVGIERFRPNLVIYGAAAYEEDQWRQLQIDAVQLAIVKPCARCSITLVDPITAEVGIEPLRTLSQYRKMPGGVLFAQNALVTMPGRVRVGSAVQVLERN